MATAGLFGSSEGTLTDTDWIARANDARPPNLSALQAHFIDGARAEKWLQIAFEPG